MSNELLHLKIEKPKEVTFVLIAFNESNGILDCISSVLNQDIEASEVNIAVLVVDDGSTDGTADLVEKNFRSKVKVIRQENMGRGYARLKGIESVETPLIAMVDSDIRLPTNWLTICLENLDSNAGVGGVAVPDGDCTTIQRIFNLNPKVKTGSIYVTGNNALFRTDVLKDSGREWLTPLGEDFRLNHALLKRGFKLQRIDNLVVQHVECKTYRDSIEWFYISGVDATRLWLEFRKTRIPDLAAVAFIGSVVTVPLLVPLLGSWFSILPFLLISLVGLIHLLSKFYCRTNYLGFMVAWLPNSVLMLSYFLGRISGIVSLIVFRIERN